MSVLNIDKHKNQIQSVLIMAVEFNNLTDAIQAIQRLVHFIIDE